MNLCCHAMHTCTPLAQQNKTMCSQRAVHEVLHVEKKAALSLHWLCGGQCAWQPHLGEKISNITQELVCTGTHLLHCSWPAVPCHIIQILVLVAAKDSDRVGTADTPWRCESKSEEDMRIFGCFPLSLLFLHLLNFAGLPLNVWEHFFPLKWN